MSDPHLSWAVRASRADTRAALDLLMDDWYGRVKADRGLHASIGFDSSMESRDWDSAKHSIEQTHGRSSREHRQTLDTLAAAIQSRKTLTRPAG
jgi:hypothetical protein